MVPKKTKDVIADFCRDVCTEKGYDPEHVEMIIPFFYDELRRQMIGMNYDFLRIPGLGVVFLKIWSIKRRIISCYNTIKENKHITGRNMRQLKEEHEHLTEVSSRMEKAFYTRVIESKAKNADKIARKREEKEKAIQEANILKQSNDD